MGSGGKSGKKSGNATGKGGKKGTTVPGTTTEEVTMDKKEGKMDIKEGNRGVFDIKGIFTKSTEAPGTVEPTSGGKSGKKSGKKSGNATGKGGKKGTTVPGTTTDKKEGNRGVFDIKGIFTKS